jgi:DNA-binding SARP family transcriptional activator
MEGRCRVRLLGRFSVEVDGRAVPAGAWRHRRGADLVKVLALTPGHRLRREQLMDLLWPDFPPEPASANLRKATYFARQALGSESSIRVQGGVVELWPDGELIVDVEEFEAAAEHGDGALPLYAGDLLPEDRYAEWSEPHRERLRHRFLELLRRSGQWERIVEIDRSDEDAHRQLMRRHLAAGNRQAALRQFAELRQALRVDLGLGPDRETVALYEKALELGAEPPTPSERATAMIARGLAHWSRGELDEAEALAREARALAVQEWLGRELGEASTLLGLVALMRGRWDELFREEFLEVVERAPGQASFVLDAHICLQEAALARSNPESMTAMAQELLAVAEKSGAVQAQALMRVLIGATALFAGRLDESETQLSEATRLYGSAAGGSGRAVALLWLAELARVHGEPARALDLLAQARLLGAGSELRAHLLPRAFAGTVRAAETLEAKLAAVEEAELTLAPAGLCGPCSIGLCVASAIACAQSGDVAKARKCLAEADRLAGMWQGGPWVAATWEARAHLRDSEGRHEQAAALLTEAADLFAESGHPLDAARCRAGLTVAV